MIVPTDPSYPVYPIFAFLGFVCVLIPLPWHFQAWNSGTCLFMMWTALSCLIGFVNSVVWRESIADVAPIWCDISTRLMIGIAVGIPTASLCINRRLYKIASCQTVSISKAEKRRAVLVDLAIGLGIPFVQMPLQFVVQGHRYDILENVGCYPTTYNVVPAYPLSILWPNFINLISACYAILTLRAFLQRRARFAEFLSTTTGLTPARYFRLMALASLELLLNLPITSYGLYLTASRSRIAPWISWNNTHADFLYVGQIPAIFWRSDHHTQTTVELSRWVGIICAICFFAFFGFAAEARKHYRIAFWAVAKRFGYNPPANGALPFPRLRWPWKKSAATLPSSAGPKLLPLSLPLTPIKQRPDSLFDDSTRTECDTDAHSQLSVEKACEFIMPSPSSSAYSPPQYARRIEVGAYTNSPFSSPTDSESTAAPTPTSDSDSESTAPRTLTPSHPQRPRPTTWPSLNMPRTS
ncbi:STE3-like pheromone receptor [Favolaschia claudopus]|uniref:STE3-like pheromone receptor n=1 Tax=Favolaschia claudopus TaxID=2862362 RepID=A0AAV9ZMY3_9AGAR